MPKSWVADSGGVRREITDIVVGTPTGNKVISKAWAGNSAGVPLLVFDRFKMTTTITANATSTSQITVAWTPTAGASYKLYRGATNIYTGSLLTFNDTGLAASTEYEYKVEVIVGGKVVGAPTTKATTNAVPPVTQVPREWTGTSVEWASYNGSNQKRTNWTGSNNNNPALYYGWVSSNHGQQQSQIRFNIPAEIRHCVRIDRVQISWKNWHHYKGSGGTVSMVGHHNGSLAGSAFGGSTGALRHNGNQVKWPAPRDNWINWTPSNQTEWYDLGYLTAPYANNNRTVAEEIRVAGLQGFGLVAAESGNAGYGYAALSAVLRINYLINV